MQKFECFKGEILHDNASYVINRKEKKEKLEIISCHYFIHR
jgi:hypothetical protein